MSEKKYAIRFGLSAVKALGSSIANDIAKNRNENGKFIDIYDFAERNDSKIINKKSIEALAKSGSFDCIAKNRRQIFESFDVISSYSIHFREEKSSDQMSLFGALFEEKSKPNLKNIENWTKEEALNKEFESFGFFLNEHPLDDYSIEMKKRGVIFSNKIQEDELEDNSLIKMFGVVISSKHRSGPRGRFAYLNVSDVVGNFEVMIFDEELITKARDLISDGSQVVIECLIKKDDGGTRILARNIFKLPDFIATVKPRDNEFEDIKKQPIKKFRTDYSNNENGKFSRSPKLHQSNQAIQSSQIAIEKNPLKEVKIFINQIDAIYAIKAYLSKKEASNNAIKKTRVFLIAKINEKESIVDLGEKYLIENIDLENIKKIQQIMKVEMI